ncbi:hypothetical protein [Noviherbaspirillum sp. UKPF54]|uniref:hypothetical protein n=1 Tax=Noviherbaspirillum sp. UKPF54 TaxID=2601898 RepID=UPI001FEE753C|nr:hypothetical protein [Noviherbaspirillum sp. UKPF54]
MRTLRRRGRLLNKDELVDNRPPYLGDLKVMESRDPELGRFVLRARLVESKAGTETEVLPGLHDAHLLFAGDNKMRLAGFERIDGADFAQTWSVELTAC